MSTVAEGVESPEQMAFLERHGCSVIQGYYFSKPLEEARLHEFWKAHCHERRPREVKRTNEEPLLTWSFTFSTGIAAVDGQHRNLISIINRLHGHSGDPDQVRASVAELLDYTLYHFGFEQGLMERYSLGCRPEHLAEHTDFVDQARSFAKALDREPTMVLSTRVASFLAGWLTNHILVSDKLLGRQLLIAGYQN